MIGFFFVKMLFALFITDDNELEDEVNKWVLWTFIIALGSFVFAFIQKFCFGLISENISKNIRKELYWSIMRKHVGFFDSRENNAGSLTSVLAEEV